MSLRAFHQQYEFPVIFTRFANFYGPGQQLYRIIPRTIIYGLTNRKLQLHGGGKSVRAFIFESDVADGITRAINYVVVGETYHFSRNYFITIKEAVEVVCRSIGVDFDSFVEYAVDRTGKDQSYLMDSTKSRDRLMWKDQVDFQHGVDSTVEWIKKSWGEVNKLPLNYVHKG